MDNKLKMESDDLQRNRPGRSVSLRLNSSYKLKMQAFQKSRPSDMNELNNEYSLGDLLTRAQKTDAWMFDRPSLYERRKKSTSSSLSATLLNLQIESKPTIPLYEKTELPQRYQKVANDRRKQKSGSKLPRPLLGTMSEENPSSEILSDIPTSPQEFLTESDQTSVEQENHKKDMLQALDWIQEEMQRIKVENRILFHTFLQMGTNIHKLTGMDVSDPYSILSQTNTLYHDINNSNLDDKSIEDNTDTTKNNLPRKILYENSPSVKYNLSINIDKLSGIREEFL